MAGARNICILVRRIRNLSEDSVSRRIAGELEDMSRILCYADINIPAAQWQHTGSPVDGVLILVDLDDIVFLIWSILISTEVVEIQPVRLARLASDDSDAAMVRTRENIRRKKLERGCAQVVVPTVQLYLFPGHKKVNNSEGAVFIDPGVDCSLLKGGRWTAARNRISDSLELTGVAISSRKIHAALSIIG
jgi:hypothetical protein